MLRLSRRLLVLGAAAALAAGCLSPTLPLPPPQPVVDGPDTQGNIRLRGAVTAYSEVYAINQSSNEIRGQITGRDGRYDFKLPAKINDDVLVWYKDESGEPSDAYEFQVGH